MSDKYKRGEHPTGGRIAAMPDHTEESCQRRATERNWRILDVMDDIVTSYAGASHPQVALAWRFSQPAVDSVIIGARPIDQLEDNLHALGLQLPPPEITRLNEASAPEEGYPYHFITSLRSPPNFRLAVNRQAPG